LGEGAATKLRPWLLAWLGLPVLGIANGAARDATYKQTTGELAAHQLSTATLLALMAGYLWVLKGRRPIRTSREALAIGGSWALLTILFEFGFGHWVVGDSWSNLLGLQPGRGADLGGGAAVDPGGAGGHQEAA
jgi:hypothetical protein